MTEILRINEAYNQIRSMKKKLKDTLDSDVIKEREKEDIQHLIEQIENILDDSEEGVDEFIEAQADSKKEEEMEAEERERNIEDANRECEEHGEPLPYEDLD
jgi:molecular chaperone DnaK (HSP70)